MKHEGKTEIGKTFDYVLARYGIERVIFRLGNPTCHSTMRSGNKYVPPATLTLTNEIDHMELSGGRIS